MKPKYAPILSAFFIFGLLLWMYFSLMPRFAQSGSIPLSEFSTKRALVHVNEIAKEPHYVGSANHKVVRDYLIRELQKMGLETQIQNGTTLSDWGNLVESNNILARIKSNAKNPSQKALLLLSHYDSAPHSASKGAADDASGLAVILESLRAFLHSKPVHGNDIIVLFSDAEELGLNGAALFVTQNNWAKEVGLALNFEARGTAGPGYVLMEVNSGNEQMVKAFSKANPDYPVANSLMYSIYKMLPNDTDLTVFREHGKIQGFNFAFIDDHFNYHTAQDDAIHLSPQTIAHQGSYLMPLLSHFSNVDLSALQSGSDQVYFNTPIGFFHYPFALNFILAGIGLLFLLFLLFIGLGKRLLHAASIGRGFALFFGSLIISGAVAFFGWKLLLVIYPPYKDILHGFTYNGHSYIAAFALLSLGISFLFYTRTKPEFASGDYFVAPLSFWLLLNFALAAWLPGAGFFIIPLFFALIMFAYFIVSQKTSILIYSVMALPALFVFVPFIIMFPIGLGLKMLVASAVLLGLLFGLLLPLFGAYRYKGIWAGVCFVAAIGFFIYAHFHSGYEPGKAKPNSLLYVYNANSGKAVWATYDTNPDDWTRTYLGENPQPAQELNKLPLFSKYNSQFQFTSEAQPRDIEEPTVTFLLDSIAAGQRYLAIQISPNRPINRIDIFANESLTLHNLRANQATALGQKGSEFMRKGKKILSYYAVGNKPLLLQFSIAKDAALEMELLESSFDLMQNELFSMKKRENWMMPKPFILTDAIVVRKKITPQPKRIIPVPMPKIFSLQKALRDTIEDSEPQIIETTTEEIPEN